MNDELLMTPGPVSVSRAVLEACAGPPALHYLSDWVSDYRAVCGACQGIFGTRNDVIPVFGPGSAAIEMALGSLLSRGDRVVIPANGIFGERLVEIATALGLQVQRVPSPPLQPIPVDAVADALRETSASALVAVQHETMLGVVNPIEELSALARDRGILYLVDAVSSFGGIDLQVDKWGIDVCVGVGNKCVGGPVGIAPIAVSDRAWTRVEDSTVKAAGWYLNLKTWRAYEQWGASWHPQPTTMPTTTLRALRVALQEILGKGSERHRQKYREASVTVRAALEELGFECLINGPHASPVLTSVRVPKGVDVDHYMNWLYERAGIRIAGARGDHAEGAFRIAHMGVAAEPESVRRFLGATREYMAQISVPA